MSLYETECEIKVAFEDADSMNVVWHGNYLHYLETARCDLLEKAGYTYIDMKSDGYIYPVAKFSAKYIKPASFGDVLIVKTSVISLSPSLNLKYTIYNKKTGEKLFSAESMQIAVNIETKESIYEPPKKLLQAIDRLKNEN